MLTRHRACPRSVRHPVSPWSSLVPLQSPCPQPWPTPTCSVTLPPSLKRRPSSEREPLGLFQGQRLHLPAPARLGLAIREVAGLHVGVEMTRRPLESCPFRLGLGDAAVPSAVMAKVRRPGGGSWGVPGPKSQERQTGASHTH